MGMLVCMCVGAGFFVSCLALGIVVMVVMVEFIVGGQGMQARCRIHSAQVMKFCSTGISCPFLYCAVPVLCGTFGCGIVTCLGSDVTVGPKSA